MRFFTQNLKSLVMMVIFGFSLSLAAQERTIDITVDNLTPTNGDFTITPSDDSFRYVWSFMPTEDFNALGDIFEHSKQSIDNVYKNYMNYYPDYTWEKALEDATITKDDYNYEQDTRFRYELSSGLIPDTEYTLYAFAFNEDMTGGTLYKKEFRTPAVPASDNQFDVKVLSMAVDSDPEATDKTVTITIQVTPTNDDTYVVDLAQKAWTEYYDMTTKLGVDKYISENIREYGAKYSGAQTLTFKKKKLDSDFYLFVYGYDADHRAPNTDVVLQAIHTEETGEVSEPDFVLEVSQITQTGAYLHIKPSDKVTKYYWSITLPENIEKWGGRDVFDKTMDRGWWQYLADMYSNLTWIDVMNMFLSEGEIDDDSKNMPDDVETLRWDTDYVLYAYGLDSEGERTTDIYFVDFHTLPCNQSDLNFDFNVVSVEDDPDNSFGSRVCHKVTIDIIPSNDTEQYAFNFHETKYLDQYEESEYDDYLFEQFLRSCKKATDVARAVMPGIREDRTYYLVVTGWDEAPTTKIHTFSFDYKAAAVNNMDLDAVTVKAIPGGISIEGNFDFAAITTADGKVIATRRNGGTHTSLEPGIYIVNYTTGGERKAQKVLVK